MVVQRIKNAWNAFRNAGDPLDPPAFSPGVSYSSIPPSTHQLRYNNERSLIASIYTRIAIDVASLEWKHVKFDENNRYADDKQSQLNHCLTFRPNLDQTPRSFRQDIALTLFDEGVCAVVPIDMVIDQEADTITDVYSLRVGRIIEWYPHQVKVSVYNEATGLHQDIIVEKRRTAIIQNPLISVMNSRNSTLQRLIRKLNQLDITDDRVSSGKLDLIIQLPYVIKSEARRQQAEERRNAIEMQLKGSQHGIAYADGTEKIVQLNRPAENNLLKQVETLTAQLHVQLGLTEEVMNGTATEEAMNNYYHRTIEPIVDDITEAMQVAFLGSPTVEKNERIRHYKNPFKYATVDKIAESADKLARNEIVTSNEVRGFMGLAPSKDPKADLLINSNMPQANPTETAPDSKSDPGKDEPTDG